jgi:galactitol-specific phosphotransferase system IIB component
MTINLNFNLEAWIKSLNIEATSEEDAIKKLMSMTLAEIIAEDAVVDSAMKFTEIETEVREYDLVVSVTDITYDLDPEVMDISVIEYLKGLLPTKRTFTLEGISSDDEIEDRIRDEIYGETDYDAADFKYNILEKK